MAFGKQVLLEVFDEQGSLVFSSDGLRVDFEVNLLEEYNRATIKVFNINTETVKKIVSNEKRYATLTTQLHDQNPVVLMDSYYISNAFEEVKVPNTITTLFCFDKAKINLDIPLENFKVSKPSLRRILKAIEKETKIPEIKPKGFPKAILDTIPDKPYSVWNGSAMAYLKYLSKEHSFNFYTEVYGVLCLYKPTQKNSADTDLQNDLELLQLDVTNMKSNPRVSVSTLEVVSNLDGRVERGLILDTTKLFTIATSEDEELLQLADEFLQRVIFTNIRFRVHHIVHSGSNYTQSWDTVITAIGPDKGTSAKTDGT